MVLNMLLHNSCFYSVSSGLILLEVGGHLEDLITLLLPAAEPFVDGTVGQLAVHM